MSAYLACLDLRNEIEQAINAGQMHTAHTLFETLKTTVLRELPDRLSARAFIAYAGRDFIHAYTKSHDLPKAETIYTDLYTKPDRLIPDALLTSQTPEGKATQGAKTASELCLINMYLALGEFERALALFPNSGALPSSLQAGASQTRRNLGTLSNEGKIR